MMSSCPSPQGQVTGASQPSPDHPRGRLRSLDALRGIAAMLVVVGHVLEELGAYFPRNGSIEQLLDAVAVDYFNFGRAGVVAFFLLSGYVVPFSFSHERPLRSFVTTRFFRLYPTYWVSVALAVPVVMFTTGAPVPLARVLANLTMAQRFLGQEDLIGVYWTLVYELMFYVICMAAFFLGRMESPRYLLGVVALCCGLGLVAAVLRYSGLFQAVPIGIPLFLAVMHLGTLARLADRGSDGPAAGCFRIALVVVLVTAGPITGIGFIKHAISETLIGSITGVYVGLALFFGLRHSRAICAKPLLFLGLISYSLYLFHPLILLPVLKVAPDLPPAAGAALLVVGVPLGGILLAAAIQRWVEAPFNTLGKSLRHRGVVRP